MAMTMQEQIKDAMEVTERELKNPIVPPMPLILENQRYLLMAVMFLVEREVWRSTNGMTDQMTGA
jgi:hypothetical protein